jgi:preprotein translocase subunit SecA
MRIKAELGDMEAGAQRKQAEQKIRDEIGKLKEKALAAGGLYVVGTERHESRRIDNQLRGRSGRQGDPGRSKFYLSLEDDLMRIFGSNQLGGMLTKLGLQEGEAIVHPWINKALEKAQQKVEARNFDIRKNLLKYDDVSNDQRKVIFEQRIDLMRENDVAETIADMRHSVIDETVTRFIPPDAYPEQWDTQGLEAAIEETLGIKLPITDWAKEEGIADEEVKDRVVRAADDIMAQKVAKYGSELFRYVEKSVLMQTLDHLWREHLVMLEHLRQVIGLRSFAQRDPLNEYKSEAFTLFETMLSRLRQVVSAQLLRIEIMERPPEQELPEMQASHINPHTGEDELAAQPVRLTSGQQPKGDRTSNNPSDWGKVGRNEPCPCGSGKKYKNCHGRLA